MINIGRCLRQSMPLLGCVVVDRYGYPMASLRRFHATVQTQLAASRLLRLACYVSPVASCAYPMASRRRLRYFCVHVCLTAVAMLMQKLSISIV